MHEGQTGQFLQRVQNTWLRRLPALLGKGLWTGSRRNCLRPSRCLWFRLRIQLRVCQQVELDQICCENRSYHSQGVEHVEAVVETVAPRIVANSLTHVWHREESDQSDEQ